MKKILLHACCGPCALYPIGHFKNENYNVTAYFYNPNIHPREEHEKRSGAFRQVVEEFKIEMIDSREFKQAEWGNFSGSTEERCEWCYRQRLEETANKAAELNFGAFSSSLLISPYQNHELIKEICEELGKKSGVEFIYVDFRKCFREGQQAARNMGIYRQRYCGCISSLK